MTSTKSWIQLEIFRVSALQEPCSFVLYWLQLFCLNIYIFLVPGNYSQTALWCLVCKQGRKRAELGASLWGWWSTGTGCPGRLWSLSLWRYSRPGWTRSCAACCRCPCLGRGVGLDDPELPSNPHHSVILWNDNALIWDQQFKIIPWKLYSALIFKLKRKKSSLVSSSLKNCCSSEQDSLLFVGCHSTLSSAKMPALY